MTMQTCLIEKSTYFSVFQHADKRSFVVDFGYRSITLTFCELLYLRKQIGKLSKHSALVEMIERGSVEIISLCNNEHFFILSPLEIIDLRELIEQLFTS